MVGPSNLIAALKYCLFFSNKKVKLRGRVRLYVKGELKPPMTHYKAIIFFRFFGLKIGYNKTDFLKRTGFIQTSCSYQAIHLRKARGE